MSRMVKCRATGICGESAKFYKIGRDWFKDKNAYINYLKSGSVIYQDISRFRRERNVKGCLTDGHPWEGIGINDNNYDEYGL